MAVLSHAFHISVTQHTLVPRCYTRVCICVCARGGIPAHRISIFVWYLLVTAAVSRITTNPETEGEDVRKTPPPVLMNGWTVMKRRYQGAGGTLIQHWAGWERERGRKGERGGRKGKKDSLSAVFCQGRNYTFTEVFPSHDGLHRSSHWIYEPIFNMKYRQWAYILPVFTCLLCLCLSIKAVTPIF